MTTTTRNTVSIGQYAFNLACMTRKTLEGSEPFHAAYTTADTEQRKALRSDWMLGHVQGTLGVDGPKAERILSKGKGAGAKAEHVKALARATAAFRYHVIRPEGKVATPSDELQVPKSIQVLADALAAACSEYEGARKIAATALAKSFAA